LHNSLDAFVGTPMRRLWKFKCECPENPQTLRRR
jgi:hypothetical protein